MVKLGIRRYGALTVVAALALTVGLTGGAVAGGMITGKDIKNKSIKAKDLASDSVHQRQLAKKSVSWEALTPNAQKKIAGFAGKNGADGTNGTNGTDGQDGAPGPALASWTTHLFQPSATSISTTSLPAGSVITGKAITLTPIGFEWSECTGAVTLQDASHQTILSVTAPSLGTGGSSTAATITTGTAGPLTIRPPEGCTAMLDVTAIFEVTEPASVTPFE